MITLHGLKANKKSKKRVGRGNSSGHGTYSTRGIKGQKARSGGSKRLKLKGFKKILLSMPKKRGFNSDAEKAQVVSLEMINKNFKEGDEINKSVLAEKRIISNVKSPVKILAKGELNLKGLKISGCGASKTALEQIKKMGGELIVE